ncbi:Uncharacterized protein dnm_078160 [Desulfonema magnum]|uniref:Uncharacterized protein n=1 Tax=Desulfonema magnum TaxID=45655 RepID=A0A975BUI4_9BACT|nr:Uncharacterized protein dnm_078160 [Desulfonema magnum]
MYPYHENITDRHYVEDCENPGFLSRSFFISGAENPGFFS